VGYSSAEVATVIEGTGFLAKVTVPQGGGASTYDTQHHVRIGDHELTGVTWRSTTKLEAMVPKGLAPGKYDLTVENTLGNRGTAKAAYEVIDTPPFSATAVADHPSVSVGQTLQLTVTIANTGQGDVTDFALPDPVISQSDGGSATLVTRPTDVPSVFGAGHEQGFVWTYMPNHVGNISIEATATGVDSLTGEAVTASLAAPVAVVINSLTATLTASSTAPAAGEPVTMSLVLANAAGGSAADVTAVTPSVTPGAGVSCTAAAASTGAVPSATAPIRIAGGATETFAWACTGSVAGQYTLSAAVTASDVNAGASIATSVTGIDVTYAGPPAAPAITNAVPGNGQVTLTWTAPSSNGAPITSYLVTANSSAGVSTANSTLTTFTFGGLENGRGYTFTVAAINSVGTGPASPPSATVAPTAAAMQADMVATASGFPASAAAGAVVAWTATCTNAGSDAATNATCTVAGATPASCTPAPTLAIGAAITCTVSYTMPASGSVTATVTAHSDTSDPTPANDTATATTSVVGVPGAPTNVVAVATGVSGEAHVSWSAPASDGGSPITGYTVAGGPGGTVTTAVTSVTIAGLTPGTPYTFTVAATNAVGPGAGTASAPVITP
jgi:titin